MRLNESEKITIKAVVAALDPKASVYLFGSRVDDTRRGGDIDLLIMSDVLSASDRGTIHWELCSRLGEQKIDIVIAKDTTDPFVNIAYKTGVRLP